MLSKWSAWEACADQRMQGNHVGDESMSSWDRLLASKQKYENVVRTPRSNHVKVK